MHRNMKLVKRISSLLLCMTLVLSGLMLPQEQVQASESVKSIAGLGTSMITDPIVPVRTSVAWKGNYVYFGKYNGILQKYRVLDANTTDYSADGTTQTMLLDCNRVLYNTQFDQDGKANADGKNASDWSVSDIKNSVNGTDFLNKTGVFTDAERNAIAASTVESHPLTTDSTTGVNVLATTQGYYNHYVALTGEKIFLLDAEDLSNEAYGYTMGHKDDAYLLEDRGTGVRAKEALSNLEADYWIRSAKDQLMVGSVAATDHDYYNHFSQYSVNYADPPGVSPAFNVNLASVLFSSVVNETNSNGGTSYELTLIDDNMTIAPKGVTKSGKTITIPYTISGSNSANATQVSVLVLDKEYTPGNTNDANILDYQNITANGFATSGSGTYTLSSSLSGMEAGTDYYVYVLAEDVNGSRETDYASAPVEIHFWEAPTAKEMNFGTQGIIGPAVPNHPRDAWKGCYVYFGKYGGNPVKYRVLDACTTDYSEDQVTQTMLLDCDSILYSKALEADDNVWKDSAIYDNLNGSGFLDKEGVFTAVEKEAIAASTVASHALTTDNETGANVTEGIQGIFKKYVALSGEKIFLLDVEDISNATYGYTMTSGENRIKKNDSENEAVESWFLRSADSTSFSKFGAISSVGGINSGFLNNTTIGVSPALNLKLSSVLFTSATAVSKTSALTSESTKIGTTTNTDWKLTLNDGGKTVALTEARSITRAGDGTITVPYTYTDSAVTESDSVNQISVMITDEAYGSESAGILYYGALDNIKNTEGEACTVAESATGSGTFTFPSALAGTLGEDYHVYLLAEHVSEGNGTDFAGEPLEITAIRNKIDTVDITGVEMPVPEQPLNSSIAVSATGVSDEATILWKKGADEATGDAEWNTTYKAYVKLSPEDGYTFTDAAGQISVITVNGELGDSKDVIWNTDGTLTVYLGEYTTTKRKIENVTPPEVPEQFTASYTTENVLASTELGMAAQVTLQGTSQPNPVEMEVQWSIVDAEGNIVPYDATPYVYNAFKWTIKPSEYAQYDVNDVVTEGTVTIRNKRAVLDVTTFPTVADRIYHPAKYLLNSDIVGGEVKDQTGNVVTGTWNWKEQKVVPSVDKKKYEAVFVPADKELYDPIPVMVAVNVTKATPVIVTQPTASDITIGMTLQDSVLSGGEAQISASDVTKVAGTFSWKDAAEKPLEKDSGVTKYEVVFTPSDTVNYNTVKTNVTVKIAIPTVGATDASDDGKATYKITEFDLEEGTVSYVAPTNKSATEIIIPDTVKVAGVIYKVTAIEKNAFKNNKKIRSITIGNNITSIGANAFYGCRNVKSITIGKNVSKIGAKAFYGCKKVKTLTIKSTKLTVKTVGKKAFSKTPKNMKVSIPKKKFKSYKSMLIKRGVSKKAKFKKRK